MIDVDDDVGTSTIPDLLTGFYPKFNNPSGLVLM